jgi:hypothetical protein
MTGTTAQANADLWHTGVPKKARRDAPCPGSTDGGIKSSYGFQKSVATRRSTAAPP